jgi:uncharacterized protein (DUF1501 family)
MSCYECSRADAAQAGRGLPSIEPGMPLPAGTGLTRREFVSRTAGLALAVYGGSALSARAFDHGIAQAASDAAAAQTVLVSIFLNGGIDGLNVLFPAGDPKYYSLRPNIALAQTAGTPFVEDPRLRWHPAANGLSTLHGEGKVSAIPAAGYANSSQSHFTARHYYEVGATETTIRTGWLGRYLDTIGTQDNPLQGLTLDVALHPSLATAGSIAYDSHHLYYQLGNFKYGFNSPVPYPSSSDPFPHRLAGLAAMIAGGMPMRVVGLTVGHFDTHATQGATLQRDLQLASDSILAFQRDIEARGIADRVLIHVWSEFGRRAQENASAGTDHGSAGIGFLIGTKLKGQMIGSFPGITGGLDSSGNLTPTADFRAVQAAILEQWLGADGNRIMPEAQPFQRPTLLK